MDLEVLETGNGGDLKKKPKDLSVITGFQNMLYLAMFGGNTEQSTPLRRNPEEQAFDWWGNTLFMPNNASQQFNSETERALNTVPLNSSGRMLIQQAVNKDTEFMKPFANVSVIVTIVNVDRILIAIRVLRPSNLEQKVYAWIWDNTIRELLEREVLMRGRSFFIPTEGIFDITFDDSFE